MTPLGAALARRIAREGPVTVAAFMEAALGDSEFGYYRRREAFGAAGDFITAPEISQMFGELIGLWCLSLFERMKDPGAIRLIELGPGRGTLMADLLRATRIRPAFHEAVSLHLVETSPRLRDVQRKALCGIETEWHEDLQGAMGIDGPVVVVANEFFDALPVHQIERTESGWRERLVAYEAEAERFFFTTADGETGACALVPPALRAAFPGTIFEASPRARALMAEIAGAVARRGGATLVIDYGHIESAAGDTLQAVRGHRYHDVLTEPGTADVTAHVDFAALADAAAAAGARVWGPVAQGDFLRRLGIEARAAILKSRATGRQADEIESALRRLIDADKMGSLFKVLAAAHPELPVAGF